jgi:haloalkane dehalogenase
MMNTTRRQVIRSLAGLAVAPVLGGCAMRASEPGPGDSHALDAATFTRLRRVARTRYGDVAYVSQGSGRAVLLLHGFPLNGFQWRGVIGRLAPHAHCIAPDFLGMGLSACHPDQDLGPESQADMLVALLDAIGIRRADVIANDSGNAVAQLLAVRHPQRIRTLLLTNGDSELQSPPAAMLPVIELARQGRFVDQWLAPWHADPRLARSSQGIGGMCYADPAHPSDEALRMYFGPAVESAERKAALHRHAVALGRNALAGISARLREKRLPVRVVWGMDDTIFDAANADHLAGSFADSHGVRRLAGAKLFWPEEQPDVIAAQARILWESARV